MEPVTPQSAAHWIDECDEPTVDPGLVAAALEKQLAPSYHDELILTPSTVLGKVRDQFIKRTMDIWPEGQGFNSSEMGTAVADWSESAMVRVFGFQRQVTWRGELWGEPYATTVDLLATCIGADGKRHVHLRDNKFKGEKSFQYQVGRGLVASEEDAAQVNLGVMLGQQAGAIPMDAELELWVQYSSPVPAAKWENKRRVPQDSGIRARVPAMTLEEIGQLHSLDSLTTVKQNHDMLTEGFNRVRAGEDPVKVLEEVFVLRNEVTGEVELPCEPCLKGSACTFYCGSNRVCLTSAGRSLGEKGIVEIRGAGIPRRATSGPVAQIPLLLRS